MATREQLLINSRSPSPPAAEIIAWVGAVGTLPLSCFYGWRLSTQRVFEGLMGLYLLILAPLVGLVWLGFTVAAVGLLIRRLTKSKMVAVVHSEGILLPIERHYIAWRHVREIAIDEMRAEGILGRRFSRATVWLTNGNAAKIDLHPYSSATAEAFAKAVVTASHGQVPIVDQRLSESG